MPTQKQWTFHPIARIFPLLEGDELNALAEDIRQHGQREDAWLYEGQVLDGRNRVLACDLVDVEPRFRPFEGSRSDAIQFVWSENYHRRHQNPGARAASFELMRRMEAEFAAEVEKIKGEAGKRKAQAAGQPRGQKASVSQIIDEENPNARRTDAALAKAAGTNRTYLAATERMSNEQLEAVASGNQKITDVIRDQKREALIAQLEDVATQATKATEGVYDVLVIDPPWPMEKIERDERPNQADLLDYQTLTEDQLADPTTWYGKPLPAAPDCHVWLWTTHRFLPTAFRLLDAWGLRYICTFVWHKPGGFQPVGLPQYNCEFALYARNGAPKFVDTKALLTCFEAPRGKHSEKPEAFYETVRRVTAGRRLDMFNRRAIDGFDTWGYEAK